MPTNDPIQDLRRKMLLLEDRFSAGISLGTATALSELGVARTSRSGGIRGNWVRVSVETLGANVAFQHNLNLTTPTGKLNVGWPWWYWRHDGTNDGSGDTVSLGYIDGTIGANSIELQVFAAGSRTVSASHPIIVRAFFIPVDD